MNVSNSPTAHTRARSSGSSSTACRSMRRASVTSFGVESRIRACATQTAVVGLQIASGFASYALDFGLLHSGSDDAPLRCDVTLSCSSNTSSSAPSKRSAQRCAAVAGVDELAGNAHAIARLAYTAFQHVSHAEFASDLPDVGRLALVGKTRIAGDHEQRLEARQAGDDVFDHAVDEVLLLGVAAHVLERQHGDGWLVGQRQRCRRGLQCPRA